MSSADFFPAWWCVKTVKYYLWLQSLFHKRFLFLNGTASIKCNHLNHKVRQGHLRQTLTAKTQITISIHAVWAGSSVLVLTVDSIQWFWKRATHDIRLWKCVSLPRLPCPHMNQSTTKPTIRLVQSAKTQIRLRIGAVWSVFVDRMCLLQPPGYPERDEFENLAQYEWMYRIIWIFAGNTGLFVGFVRASSYANNAIFFMLRLVRLCVGL